MQAPRYSPLQDSLFTKPDSKALVAVLLTPWHRPRCLKCHQPRTPYCCQPQTQNSAAYHSLAPSLWYFVPAEIHERHCESSISWTIWACKLVCLLGVILKKDWKLGFQLAIPLSSEVFATQPNLVTQGIALRLDSLIVGLLLKFLGVVEILLTNGHEVLELKR